MFRKPCSRAGLKPYCFHVWSGPLRVTWWWRGRWRGVSLPVFERYDLSSSVPRLLSRTTEPVMIKPDAAKVMNVGADVGAWKKVLPHLGEFLCSPSYPDGTPIGQVQIQITRQGNAIRATLKIEDQGGLRVSAVGTSPDCALLALNLLLESPACPWEKDSYALGQTRAKKK